MNTNIEDEMSFSTNHTHTMDLHALALLIRLHPPMSSLIPLPLLFFSCHTQKLDSRVDDEEEEEEVPAQNHDYRSFFDFGYFSDLAASVANAPHPATQTGNSITIRKQKGQNTVELEKFVIPNFGQNDASKKVDEFF